MRRSWLRHLGAALGAAGVFVVAAGGLALVALPRLVERVVVSELTARGIAPARLRVRSIGVRAIEIDEIRLGRDDALRIAHLGVRYRLARLLAGHIDAVAIEGLRLIAGLDSAGLHAGGVVAALAGGEGGALPVGLVEVTDARARLTTPWGPLAVTAGGRAAMRGGRLEGGFDVTLGGDAGTATGRLAVAQGAGGGYRTRFVIAGGRVALPGALASGLGGSVRVSGAPLRLDADLSVERLETSHLALVGVGVEATAADGRVEARARARDAAGKASAEAPLAAPLAGERQSSLVVEASSGDLAATFPGLAGIGGGAASVALAITGRLPDALPDQENGIFPWLLRQRAAGHVEFGAFGVDAVGSAEGVAADGRLVFEVADGALALAADGPVSLSAERLVGGPLARYLGGGDAVLLIGGGDHTALTVTARGLKGGTVGVLAAGGGELDAPRGRFAAEVIADAQLDASGLARLDVPALDLVVSEVTTAAGTRLGGGVRASFGGSPTSLRGAFEGDLAVEGLAIGEARAEAVRLAIGGDLAFDGGRLVLALGRGRLRADGLAASGAIEITGPLTAALAPGGRATIAAGSEDGLAVDLELPLGELRAAGVLHAGGPGAPFSLAVARGATRLRLRGGTLAPGAALRFEDGSVALPDRGVRLTGLAGGLRLEAPGRLVGELSRGRADLGGLGLAPFDVTATARSEGGGVVVDGELAAAGETVRLSVEAEYDRGSGEGRARLHLAPLRFEPGRLAPADLAPGLAGRLADVSGTVAALGAISWRPGERVVDVSVAVNGLAGWAGPARFADLNGVVRFDALWPPATPAGQEIAVGLLDLGLPLTDGLVRFRLVPEGAVEIERAVWHWGGGEISVAGITVTPGRRDYDFVMAVSGLELGTVVGLAGIEGIEATGRLNGRVPVRLRGGRLTIEGGILSAAAPGILRYAPKTVPAALRDAGQGVSLMLAALENFRYETLRLTLDKPATGTASIAVHIAGANPDFYEGRPVNFNLTLDVDLEALLGRGLEGYRVPQAIRRRLQRFGE